MERRAQSGRSLLQRLPAERRKREADATATEQAAWVEHCAIGLMADELPTVPSTPTAAPSPGRHQRRTRNQAKQRPSVSPRRAVRPASTGSSAGQRQWRPSYPESTRRSRGLTWRGHHLR
jgi:hypothetical protein